MAAKRATLKKEINLRSLFSLAFGTIIGVGWITVMGDWLSRAGPIGAIIGFVGGGLLMMAVALCYAEMATMYPVSGGEVAYVYQAWGTHWSFAAGWFLAFIYIFVTSFEAISVGWILSALIPGSGGPVIYTVMGEDVQLWSLIFGVGIMMVITAVNYRGGRTTAAFQDAMTYTLLLATLVFVVVGLAGGETLNRSL